MKLRPAALLVLLLVAATGLVAVPAHAVIVERVVAVVGERPILLSDLRRRARPFLVHVMQQTQNPAQVAAQETEVYRELLNKMIDERMEEQAADKAHVSVSSEDIDRAINQKADAVHMNVRDLLAEARKEGLSEQDYRDELRRQILEGKLIQLRVVSRVRVTEEDARAAYVHWLKELGGETIVDLRVLARRLDPNWSPQEVAAEDQLEQSIVTQARTGTSFCVLVKQYSQDPQTRDGCGYRGPTPSSSLFPEVQNAVTGMKAGDTTDPINFSGQASLIVQLVKPPRVPPYEEVKPQMMERAYGEVIDRQRKMWLQELRRGVYIDVRL